VLGVAVPAPRKRKEQMQDDEPEEVVVKSDLEENNGE
jgi:hypothetical protein